MPSCSSTSGWRRQRSGAIKSSTACLAICGTSGTAPEWRADGSLSLFVSTGISMRRLEGHIEPDEARQLIREAGDKLSPADRRAFAYALKLLIDQGQVGLVRAWATRPDGTSFHDNAKEILTPFI